MHTYRSTLSIPAPRHIVRQILLEPAALAGWNPAFLSIQAPQHAETGRPYPILVRGGLTGHWEYQKISESRIEATWQVPGLHETTSWHLHDLDRFTHVVHTFRQRGALAALLLPAFAHVADLRLTRLSERAAGRAAVAPDSPEAFVAQQPGDELPPAPAHRTPSYGTGGNEWSRPASLHLAADGDDTAERPILRGLD